MGWTKPAKAHFVRRYVRNQGYKIIYRCPTKFRKTPTIKARKKK